MKYQTEKDLLHDDHFYFTYRSIAKFVEKIQNDPNYIAENYNLSEDEAHNKMLDMIFQNLKYLYQNAYDQGKQDERSDTKFYQNYGK